MFLYKHGDLKGDLLFMAVKAMPPISVIDTSGNSSSSGGATPSASASDIAVFPTSKADALPTENPVRLADNSYPAAGRPPAYSDYSNGWHVPPGPQRPQQLPPPQPNPVTQYGWNQISRNDSLQSQASKIVAAFRNEFGYLQSTTLDELLGKDSRDSLRAQDKMLNILHILSRTPTRTYASNEDRQQDYGASINVDMENLITAVRQSHFANCNDQARIIRYRLQQVGIPSSQIDMVFNNGRGNRGESHTAVILSNRRLPERPTPQDLAGTVVIDPWRDANRLDAVLDSPVKSGNDWIAKTREKYLKQYPWDNHIVVAIEPNFTR